MRRTLSALLLLIPSVLLADGMIVIPRPVPTVPRAFPLSVTYHHVTVDIDDQVAVTRVEQTFRNHTDRQLEATYIFPVPKGASVRRFSMWVDGKEIMNHKGSVGYNTGSQLPYFKFGYYNWNSFKGARKVMLREPVVVADPTGSKYTQADLRSHINK